ncbi:MAG: phosphoribosylformylglycinamidine synthase subunit PurQ [Bryobacteraceae bacterium]|nr:phosphoribosylformylglycinamidine synthase subunit PurQ [Bryobacteraceae bacterium]MDW8378641.1 phosphoribosylformylglycinamidine synthase subunit PurQ [Bryobacterales bacterium]
MTPTVNVVYFPGTNCQRETLRAFERVGAKAHLIFASDLLQGRSRLDSADILCLPGGFSFGDHIMGGLVASVLLTHGLKDQLANCRQRLILGICNGFQIAIRAGLFGPHVTLTWNDCGTFQDIAEQPHVVARDHGTPWLRGLEGETLTFPCAHGEGKFIFTSRQGWRRVLSYPAGANPDGSMEDIAGIATADGQVFGLMNHPERALHRDANLQFFENGVNWVRS